MFICNGQVQSGTTQTVTVPRMELTAAAVAVKMDQILKQELDMQLEESLFWTDSMTVLKYIENDAARYKTFVANRVSLIREASKPSQWRFVNSSENPADHVSRGLKAENLMGSDDWIEGPPFLLRPCDEWPVSTDQRLKEILCLVSSELKKMKMLWASSLHIILTGSA